MTVDSPSARDRVSASFTPSAAATVGTTAPGSVTAAISTYATPPGKEATSSSETAMATRVFPVPPGPVMVTTRVPERRRSTTRATSDSRPTRGVAGDDDLPQHDRVAAGKCGLQSVFKGGHRWARSSMSERPKVPVEARGARPMDPDADECLEG
jgi:hypothetical protein